MTLPTYTAFLALLAREAQGEPPPRPGDVYRWNCGCHWTYRCDDWEHTRRCPRHAHMARDVRQSMLREEGKV